VKLPEALGHDISHESAHVPTIKPEQAITSPQQEIAPVVEHGIGMDIASKSMNRPSRIVAHVQDIHRYRPNLLLSKNCTFNVRIRACNVGNPQAQRYPSASVT
jgi:hypothetical protein